MELLRAKPISRDPDDGMSAVYECERCLTTVDRIVDPYATPDHIRCSSCGYYEGDDDEC